MVAFQFVSVIVFNLQLEYEVEFMHYLCLVFSLIVEVPEWFNQSWPKLEVVPVKLH